jgi:hypothetical protein
MLTQLKWWCGKSPLWGGRGALSPAKDYVELRWNWFEMGLNNNLHVEFYTISGQLAAKQAIANYQNNIAVIPTVGLPTGLYLVNVVNDYDEVLFTEKLTINK